ncbi:MAG TPA: methyltransferase [Rectinemataceae bacterium]|nr:methyltransferase [Rectinemataceae bacterium]
MTDLQPLVNKTVEFAYRGARLGFDLSHALFSSYAIDTGTRFLLKEIAHDETITGASAILDAGCGVGIIGISLAVSCPQAKVVMRDRDILACAFSERNCWKNGIPVQRLGLDDAATEPIAKKPPKHKNNEERRNAVIVAPGLLGEDDPLGPFDAVVSNLPAKAGPVILSQFVEACAGKLLNPGGRLAFVIVNTLAGLADSWCASSGMIPVRKTAGKGHSVFILEKPASPSASAHTPASAETYVPDTHDASAARTDPFFEQRRVSAIRYRRSSATRKLGRYPVPACGFWGLPEFDTTGFATEMAMEALEKACAGSLVRDLLISEPGIGLPALWACKALGPARIHALSRDLLSLLATRANIDALSSPHPDYFPLQSIDGDGIGDILFDAILWFPDEVPEYDFIAPAWEFLHRTAKKGAAIVIVSTSTTTTRFEKTKPSGIQRLGEKKKKGFSALMFRRVD